MLKEFHQNNRRSMPWRDFITPYRVVVSEYMLQQTQVPRVITIFPGFMQKFPDFQSLSGATLEEVLRAWQGLGYNRRAKFLWQTAQEIVERWEGVVPDDPEILKSLPGIGAATAGSISAFVYNRPVIFIETNVRRVFIHHFFRDKSDVPDKEIIPLIKKTLDTDNPREWYYSLMDYGTSLSRMIQNPNRRSSHYNVQSPFKGSDRKLRGEIVKILLNTGPLEYSQLIEKTGLQGPRANRILSQLVREGFIVQDKNTIRFP